MNRHSNRHASTREAQVAFKILMTHKFCNSHDVSHFAAFFIVVGAKTSVAESVCLRYFYLLLLTGVYDKFVTRCFGFIRKVDKRKFDTGSACALP